MDQYPPSSPAVMLLSRRIIGGSIRTVRCSKCQFRADLALERAVRADLGDDVASRVALLRFLIDVGQIPTRSNGGTR